MTNLDHAARQMNADPVAAAERLFLAAVDDLESERKIQKALGLRPKAQREFVQRHLSPHRMEELAVGVLSRCLQPVP